MPKWYRVARDMFARDLWTSVPVDWNDLSRGTIRVFAREVVDASQLHEGAAPLPEILFLQGGPGGKSPRPLHRDAMLQALLPKFRVILLDQRGRVDRPLCVLWSCSRRSPPK